MVRVFTKLISQLEVKKHFTQIHKKAFSAKYLLITNLGISLTLSGTGDILEQQYERYRGNVNEWSPKRTMHMSISGLSVGLVCHYWYQFLDKRLPQRNLRVVMKKIVLDQLICSPAYISVFFITLGVLEKKLPNTIWEEVKEKAWKLYAAEWMVWPLAQFINFYWLPSKYRVFYDSMISLGYDVYTSQVKHSH